MLEKGTISLIASAVKVACNSTTADARETKENKPSLLGRVTKMAKSKKMEEKVHKTNNQRFFFVYEYKSCTTIS